VQALTSFDIVPPLVLFLHPMLVAEFRDFLFPCHQVCFNVPAANVASVARRYSEVIGFLHSFTFLSLQLVLAAAPLYVYIVSCTIPDYNNKM
jgi:hypothetical protein